MTEGERQLFSALPFEVAPLTPPGGRTAKLTQRKLALLAVGIHPITRLPLLDRVTQCRDCAHVTRIHLGYRRRSQPKCDLRDTRSEATDLRLWYPACVAFVERNPKESGSST